MISAMDHIQLAAPPGTESALRAFYVDVLGLTERAKPPVLAAKGGCWFATADGTVQLHIGIEEAFHPARKAHPGLRVTGIHGFAKRLRERGAKVVWDYDLPGHERFFSEDPAGNRIEFLEPVAMRS